MTFWLRALEAWAVTRVRLQPQGGLLVSSPAQQLTVAKLLSSPSFHRAVHNAHKQFLRLRHGVPPEELGGTNIDVPQSSFLKHFKEEIQAQLRGGTRKK